MVVPESIKALKNFKTCTVTVGKSEISHIVIVEDVVTLLIHPNLHHYLMRALVI